MSSNFEVGRDIDRFHSGVGHDSSRRISHRAGDRAQRVLGRGKLREASSKATVRTQTKTARRHFEEDTKTPCQRSARENLL